MYMYVCVYIYVRIDQLDRPCGPWTEVVLLEERASSVLFHGKGGTFGGGGMSINNSDGMVSKCCYRANSVVVQRIDIVAA